MAGHRSLLVAWVALALALGMGGCDKVTNALDPCSGERACEVDGVDLIIENATLDAAVISEINKPAVPVGAKVEVSYKVLNRGSESSSATILRTCLDGTCSSTGISELKPGEAASGNVTLVLPNNLDGDHGIWLAVDGYPQNHQTIDLLIERPRLVTAIDVLAEEVQVGTDVPAVITIKNNAYVASAAESTARVCLRSIGTSCLSQHPPVDTKTPELEPGGTRVDTLSFLLPLSALYWPDVAESHELLVCADANDSSEGSSDCAANGFTALPNLDLACGAGDIAPELTRSGTLTSTDCYLHAPGNNSDLYRFESEANGRFVVEVVDFASSFSDGLYLYVVTPRGAIVASTSSYLSAGTSFTFTVGQAGVYYLVVSPLYSANGQTYSIRLDQQ